MKKIYFLFSALFITSLSFGQIIASDDFTYANGNLVGNGGWANHSGTGSFIQVASGEVVLTHGSGSREDASISFAAVPGIIYYKFDFSVDNPGGGITGTDFEYFAHFMQGTNFSARLDIVAPTGGGDFSVGIASDESTADAVWGTDLTFGITYQVTVAYNQDTNQAQLWIDASVPGDTSILGEDRADPGDSVTAFALRQSTSSTNETVRVDNLIIGTSFGLSTKENQIDGFDLYPNPSSEAFVNISSDKHSPMKVSVFDILGKQVIQRTITNNRINISNLNTGVYILRAEQDNAFTTRKLIIN
ncbi:T9SS type A sorting domain-containing protein [Flavobacteriaceae bacterium S0862]|nr:T9SS type A sorting domain-containing protein [Flavobacteriaceae bacterium S0862]